MNYKKNYNLVSLLKHWISAPFIWAVLVPLIFLDIVMEIYHRLCFPLYGLKCVKRKDYIKLDRYKLPYLAWYDQLNCLYCEYANGLLHYASAIAGETEKYWCGIKHKSDYKDFKEPIHHKSFIKYGDKKAFQQACKLQKKN